MRTKFLSVFLASVLVGPVQTLATYSSGEDTEERSNRKGVLHAIGSWGAYLVGSSSPSAPRRGAIENSPLVENKETPESSPIEVIADEEFSAAASQSGLSSSTAALTEHEIFEDYQLVAVSPDLVSSQIAAPSREEEKTETISIATMSAARSEDIEQLRQLIASLYLQVVPEEEREENTPFHRLKAIASGVERYISALRQAEEKLNKTLEDNKQLQEQKRSFEEANAQLIQQFRDIQLQRGRDQQQAEENRQQATRLQAQIDSLTREKATLVQQAAEKQQHLDRLNSAQQSLQARLTGLERDKATLSQQFTTTQQQTLQLRREKQALEAQLEALRQEKASLTQMLENTQRQLEQLRQVQTSFPYDTLYELEHAHSWRGVKFLAMLSKAEGSRLQALGLEKTVYHIRKVGQ